jgi:CHASE2 domain-containing sensor protein
MSSTGSARAGVRSVRTRRLRVVHGLVAAGACWLLVAALHVAGAFAFPDLKLLDWRITLRGVHAAADDIAIVEVDDATVRAYGRWPLSRDQYALLVDVLQRAGAEAIGLDLLLMAPDRENPTSDTLLADVTAATPELVHAISFRTEDDESAGPVSAPAGQTEALGRHGLPVAGLDVPEAISASLPYPDLLERAGAVGHVVVSIDRDGSVRRFPPFIRYGELTYPSLSLALLGRARHGGAPREVTAVPGGVIVHWPDGKTLRLPLDREGATAVDFAGDQRAFRHRRSLLEVLRQARRGDDAGLARAFGGRIVIVGSTAVGEVATDLGTMPFSPSVPLLYVHANALDAMLAGRFPRSPPTWLYLLALLILSLVLGILYVRLPLRAAVGVMFVAVAGVLGADFALYTWSGWDVPPSAALLLPLLGFSSIAAYGFGFLERRTREREKELAVARKIQAKLLPVRPPEFAGLDVFGVNLPAQEVGGDYFDWLILDDTLVFALGDVSGKGVAAALLMSHLRASLHAEVRVMGQGGSALTVIEEMNRSLFHAIESGRFATFFLAMVRRDDPVLRYCNAGHNPALLVHEGELTMLEAGGVPLGMLESFPYEDAARPFERGDLLVLYSDGITECPWKDQMYGDERLQALVKRLALEEVSAARIGQAILDDLSAFSHGQTDADDVTLVIVRKV